MVESIDLQENQPAGGLVKRSLAIIDVDRLTTMRRQADRLLI